MKLKGKLYQSFDDGKTYVEVPTDGEIEFSNYIPEKRGSKEVTGTLVIPKERVEFYDNLFKLMGLKENNNDIKNNNIK